MARVTTLRDRINAIKRRYKKITRQKFLYNRKPDLKRRFNRIVCWFLLNSPERGYSIMRMEFTRKVLFSVSQWHSLFSTPIETEEKRYDSIYNIFTQAVLPAINVKGGNDWRFISLLAWSAAIDLRQAKNTKAPRRRNKTVKTRNANARNRNRGRH